jgi:hypothetical protein
MAALKASGLPVLSNIRLDDFLEKQPFIDGYKPVKLGYYEVGRTFYLNPGVMRRFVAEHNEIGIKVFYDGLPVLPVSEYTVIFMQRDSAEIIASLERVDEYKKEINQDLNTGKNRYPFDVYYKYIPEDVQHCLDIARQRRDINVIEVQFKDLIHNPIQTFERLRAKGVPINVDNAEKIVDPEWYRCVA